MKKYILLISLSFLYLFINGCAPASLHYAARSYNVEKLKNYMTEDINVNASDNYGKTPLMYAAESNTLEAVKFLVGEGADINAKQYGKTPLMYAIESNTIEVVKFLIDKGADINAKDGFEWTPLFYAAYYNPEAAKLLIDKGADIDFGDSAILINPEEIMIVGIDNDNLWASDKKVFERLLHRVTRLSQGSHIILYMFADKGMHLKDLAAALPNVNVKNGHIYMVKYELIKNKSIRAWVEEFSIN